MPDTDSAPPNPAPLGVLPPGKLGVEAHRRGLAFSKQSLGKPSCPRRSPKGIEGHSLRSTDRAGRGRGLPGRWLKGAGASQLPPEADATRSCCLKNSRGLSGRWAIMAAASCGHKGRVRAGQAVAEPGLAHPARLLLPPPSPPPLILTSSSGTLLLHPAGHPGNQRDNVLSVSFQPSRISEVTICSPQSPVPQPPLLFQCLQSPHPRPTPNPSPPQLYEFAVVVFTTHQVQLLLFIYS